MGRAWFVSRIILITKRSTEEMLAKIYVNVPNDKKLGFEYGSSERKAFEPAPSQMICKGTKTGKQAGRKTEFGFKMGDYIRPCFGLSAYA